MELANQLICCILCSAHKNHGPQELVARRTGGVPWQRGSVWQGFSPSEGLKNEFRIHITS